MRIGAGGGKCLVLKGFRKIVILVVRDNVFKGRKPLVPPVPTGTWSNKPRVNAAAISARRDSPVLSPAMIESEVPQDLEALDDGLYCKECYVPLHPDPPAGKLFIFLHALRYTTSHGEFGTEMPWWALNTWNGDGWVKYE